MPIQYLDDDNQPKQVFGGQQKFGQPAQQQIWRHKFSGGRWVPELAYDPEVELAKEQLKSSFPSASEKSKLAEQEQYGSRIKKMVDLFKSSYPASREKTLIGQVGKNIPLFGQSALYDRAVGAELSGKIPIPFTQGIPVGRLPAGAYPREDKDWSKMAAYEDMAEGFLTTLAKEAGEQRPTDQDVARFKKSLMGYGKDPGTNEILMESLSKDASTLSPKEFLGKYTGNSAYSAQEDKIIIGADGKKYRIVGGDPNDPDVELVK